MNAGEAMRDLTGRFQAAGIDTARLDARVLIAHVLGVEPERVFGYPETILSGVEEKRLAELAARRENRQPLARIIGEKEFWSLTFQLSDDTLVPRPETETVVEAVLEQVSDPSAPLRILDLGTGSGCLLISLLTELSGGEGVGIDISDGALRTATENARRIGVGGRTRFMANDWCKGLDQEFSGAFDIIVSNPPYIPDDEIDGLEPEVASHEPTRALAGGPDGLDIYRLLVRDAGNLLVSGGMIALEVGWTQADSVSQLAGNAGLEVVGRREDLAGVARCIMLKKP